MAKGHRDKQVYFKRIKAEENYRFYIVIKSGMMTAVIEQVSIYSDWMRKER